MNSARDIGQSETRVSHHCFVYLFIYSLIQSEYTQTHIYVIIVPATLSWHCFAFWVLPNYSLCNIINPTHADFDGWVMGVKQSSVHIRKPSTLSECCLNGGGKKTSRENRFRFDCTHTWRALVWQSPFLNGVLLNYFIVYVPIRRDGNYVFRMSGNSVRSIKT